jgi:hypothetical protein
VLCGSLTVHPQSGERSSRCMASSSLIAPALRSRRAGSNASRGSGSRCKSQSKAAARHAKTRPRNATAAGWPWKSVPGGANKDPSHDGPWHWRHGPPLGGPLARQCPRPPQPRERQPPWGQKGCEVSTGRGWRGVGGRGSGGASGGAGAGVAARSHRAHGGHWGRPAPGVGAVERLRRAGVGGTIGC